MAGVTLPWLAMRRFEQHGTNVLRVHGSNSNRSRNVNRV